MIIIIHACVIEFSRVFVIFLLLFSFPAPLLASLYLFRHFSRRDQNKGNRAGAELTRDVIPEKFRLGFSGVSSEDAAHGVAFFWTPQVHVFFFFFHFLNSGFPSVEDFFPSLLLRYIKQSDD